MFLNMGKTTQYKYIQECANDDGGDGDNIG